jgi:hypothetical protein
LLKFAATLSRTRAKTHGVFLLFCVTKKKLEEVVLRIQDPHRGFLVKDRFFHLKKYEEVFVASEAVDWLVKNLHLRNRAGAYPKVDIFTSASTELMTCVLFYVF